MRAFVFNYGEIVHIPFTVSPDLHLVKRHVATRFANSPATEIRDLFGVGYAWLSPLLAAQANRFNLNHKPVWPQGKTQ